MLMTLFSVLIPALANIEGFLLLPVLPKLFSGAKLQLNLNKNEYFLFSEKKSVFIHYCTSSRRQVL